VLVVAVAIVAFDLGSLLYLEHASRDFVVARREQALPLVRLGEPVSWRGQAPGQLYGWAAPTDLGTYTASEAAVLAFRIEGRPVDDLVLTAIVSAIVHERSLPVRNVTIAVNKTPVAHWRFDSGEFVTRTVAIPRALLADDGVVRLEFRLAEVRSPSELRLGADARRLGMCLASWTLDPSAP
jgi:hypothetical protein